MDSVEVGQVRQKLMKQLHLDLPTTLLFDHPSPEDLCQYLDDKISKSKPIAQAPIDIIKKDSPIDTIKKDSGFVKSRKMSWDTLGSKDVIEIQRLFKQELELPDVQQEISKIYGECKPDSLKYMLKVSWPVDLAEGRVLRRLGLIQELKWETIDKALADMYQQVQTFWSSAPEIQELSLQLIQLAFRDSDAWSQLA